MNVVCFVCRECMCLYTCECEYQIVRVCVLGGVCLSGSVYMCRVGGECVRRWESVSNIGLGGEVCQNVMCWVIAWCV